MYDSSNNIHTYMYRVLAQGAHQLLHQMLVPPQCNTAGMLTLSTNDSSYDQKSLRQIRLLYSFILSELQMLFCHD